MFTRWQTSPRFLIVGGGITGLAAAWRLQNLWPEAQITLIERDTRLGGKIFTERQDGFVVEGGADSFLSRKPRGVGLSEELGLIDQFQGRQPEFARTYVRFAGQLHPLPEGLTGLIPTNLDALAKSSLLTDEGRDRVAQEFNLPPSPSPEDESIASFITRRLGQEVYERLVEPLMSGIYAGDGEQLSLAATFPQLRTLELRHGSLLKGLLAGQMEAGKHSSAYPPFVSFAGGMGSLVNRLTEGLTRTTLLTGVGVKAIRPNFPGYTVLLENGQTWTADALILTTPAYVTARLVADLDAELAEAHAQIPYASSVTVSLAYAEADLPLLDGYGYVIPRVENTDVLACTWTWRKWAGRAPQGYGLLRVYLGRYGRSDMTQLTDEALLALSRQELADTLGITAVPVRHWIYRWPHAMPQYTLGHLARLARIKTRLATLPGLFVAGAAYRGVGIPDCILLAEQAAEAAAKWVRETVLTATE